MPVSDVEQLQQAFLDELPLISSKRLKWLRSEWPELYVACERLVNRDAQMTGAPPHSVRMEMIKGLMNAAVPCLSPSGHHFVGNQCTHCDIHTIGRRSIIRPIDQVRVRDMTIWCAYCGDYADTVDHVIPTSRGGANIIANLVLACRTCNGEKSDMLLEEWADRWYERPEGVEINPESMNYIVNELEDVANA